MDILQDTPTKALLAAVLRSHLAGNAVIGIDPSATGTGKTTSGSQFFNNLESFLDEVEHDHQLKVVIVASQHRYLGNYWTPHSHQRAIRFLGAEEYTRRLKERFNVSPDEQVVAEHLVQEGLVPHHCPLRDTPAWVHALGATADRKRITLTDYRKVCRKHLLIKLPQQDPGTLFEPCNHACPLAGGAFFDSRPAETTGASSQTMFSGHERPRLALLTSAKFRYRAAFFHALHGDIKIRTVDFQDIRNAVILFEEAADVFETMLGYVDDKAVSTELLSTTALIHELFNRHQFEHDWIRRFSLKTSAIYFNDAKDTIVQNGQWVPVNVFQFNPAERSDYLLPVCRDRCALVMADFPRYSLHRQGGVGGAHRYFSLHLRGSEPAPPALPRQRVKLALEQALSPPAIAIGNIIPMTAPLVNLVRATFSHAIQPYVRYCRWTYRAAVPFREHVANELHETFQLHDAVHQEMLNLALSEIDYGASVKNVRDKTQDVFAEDYYYKHGIAYCEVHRLSGDTTERDPLKITLNVSNPPPELLLYNLVKGRNSLVLSSASLRVKSLYTNINLDWLLRKFHDDQPAGPVKHEVIDMDDPARAALYQAKQQATHDLFRARRWHERPLDVHVFEAARDAAAGDGEYLDGYVALARQIKALNSKGIPAIGIVMVNSYAHARELLRRLLHASDELSLGELYGIDTDTSSSGLSVLETWLHAQSMPLTASEMPTQAREAMLFNEIETVIATRMGSLLGGAELLNGLVVSVFRKIGKGATFRLDLGQVRLSRHGRAYLGKGIQVKAANPFVDFNLLAFAEHPRNLVNKANFRRVAVHAVSVGGREMQEKLSQKLLANNYREIQRALKWSRYGVLAVFDVSIQGDGRITRCRTPLPASRHLLMSAKHARLFMLGMGYCAPGDLLITPDLAQIDAVCHAYWISHTIPCEHENDGVAEWVGQAYAGTPALATLKAIRDVRMFLARPQHHLLTGKVFEKLLCTAFLDDYDARIKQYAMDRLRNSYMTVTRDQLDRASVQERCNDIILNHGERRLSVISYRQRKPSKRAGNDVIMLLKPRELYELAYPAADEVAIMKALASLEHNPITRFSVQSAIDHVHFMGPIQQGTHEAGDFYLETRGIKLLLDAKSTTLNSPRGPAMREPGSVLQEVRAKLARFTKGSGLVPDGFVFANSGWPLQNMWYRDELPGCELPVFHMDACTTLRPEKMAIEFARTLNEIVSYIEVSHEGKNRQVQ